MKIFAVATQKGGAGKTTTAGHVGVELSRRGNRVVLVDMDPQGNLAAWWNSREAEEPRLLQVTLDRLDHSLEILAQDGFDYAVIDTPPRAFVDGNDSPADPIIRAAIRVADLVIVPSKASPHDLRAVAPTLELVADNNKPVVFLINDATANTRLKSDAMQTLSQFGKLSPVLHHRNIFVESMIDGRTAMEVRPGHIGSIEVRKLVDYLLEQTAATE